MSLPQKGPQLRAIPGWPGYFATGDGDIFSTRNHGRHYGKSKKLKRLRPSPDKNGYLGLTLCKDKKRHDCQVHLLILLTFNGPRPVGLQARHLNGQNQDNRACNLKWGTQSENSNDKRIHGTMPYGDKHPNAKLNAQQIEQLRLEAKEGRPLNKLARDFGLGESTVGRIVHGTTHPLTTGPRLGRIIRVGEKHHLTSLTEKQVIALRKEREEQHTSYPKLAKKYTVSSETVRRIILRKTWAHVR